MTSGIGNEETLSLKLIFFGLHFVGTAEPAIHKASTLAVKVHRDAGKASYFGMPLHLSTSTCRFPCIFRHVAEPAVAAVLSLSKCQQLQWACAAGEQQNPPVTTSPDRLDAPILADNNFARRDFQIEGTRGLHGDTCTADECCLARFQTGAGHKTPIHKALRTALPFPRFENVPINATRKFAGDPFFFLLFSRIA